MLRANLFDIILIIVALLLAPAMFSLYRILWEDLNPNDFIICISLFIFLITLIIILLIIAD